jgi:capsid protein
MPDTSSSTARTEAWQRELLRTETQCANYFARRVPEWIATCTRIWNTEHGQAPAVGRTLQQDLIYSARREVELRGEFAKVVFVALAARSAEMPSAQVLVDCTRKASELIRLGCRDVARDIEHAARLLPSVDSGCVDRAVAAAIERLTDHLLDAISQRPGAPIA